MTDTIGLSGLSLTDRRYKSFGQDNTPLDVSGAVFRIGGGVYEATLPTYADKDAVPFHFTSDGLLRVDTELVVSGVTIGNVKVYSTDNTAPNSAYGKVGTDQTLITQLSGTAVLSAGSVIVTQGRDLVGSMYIPAGSVIVTQGRDLIGSMYIPAGSMIVTNTVAVSGLNYSQVFPSGTFYTTAAQSGTYYNTVSPSGTFYSTVAQSGTHYNTVSPSGTFYASVTPSGTFIVSGTFDRALDNTGYAANGSWFSPIGGLYESTPTALSGNFVGALGATQYRELKIGGYNTSTNAVQVEDISPALTQYLNVVLLNAVGSNAGSHVSSAVNVENYREKIIYLQYANPGTGSIFYPYIEASPDNSVWYTIGSYAYSTAATNTVHINRDAHPYLRINTIGSNNGGALTVTLTGRGA